MKLYLLIIIFILYSSCKSAETTADRSAWSGACPKFGFLERSQIPDSGSDSSIYFSKSNYQEMIVLRDWKGESQHIALVRLMNAVNISNEDNYKQFLSEFHNICGDSVQPVGKTRYEVEFENRVAKIQFEHYFRDYYFKNKINENNLKKLAYDSLTRWENNDPFLLTYYNGNDYPNFVNSLETLESLEYRKLEKQFSEEKKKKYIEVIGEIDIKEFTYDSKKKKLYTEFDLRIGNNPLLGFTGQWQKFSLASPVEVKIKDEDLDGFLSKDKVSFQSIFTFEVVHGQTEQVDCYNIGAQVKFVYYDKTTTPKGEYDICKNVGIVKYKGLKLKEEVTLFLVGDKVYPSVKTRL
ncbi:hypothetical protein [Leptospira kobayashii]|nr:hypothetical protein [Leptospira kobayashii]